MYLIINLNESNCNCMKEDAGKSMQGLYWGMGVAYCMCSAPILTYPASSKMSCVPSGTVMVPNGFVPLPNAPAEIKTRLFKGRVTSPTATPTAAFHETSAGSLCGHAGNDAASVGLHVNFVRKM